MKKFHMPDLENLSDKSAKIQSDLYIMGRLDMLESVIYELLEHSSDDVKKACARAVQNASKSFHKDFPETASSVKNALILFRDKALKAAEKKTD